MDSLPTEIFYIIFGYLTLAENGRLRQVNKKMKNIVESYLKQVNYISLTRNNNRKVPSCPKDYWKKFTFVFDKCDPSTPINPLLWKFINSYCGDSIELYVSSKLNLDDLSPLCNKLQFLYTPYFKECLAQNFKKFPKLGYLHSLNVETINFLQLYKHSRSLRGVHFSQTDAMKVLVLLPIRKLTITPVPNQDRFFSTSIMNEPLHRLLLYLINTCSLEKYYLPWTCSCALKSQFTDCPLQNIKRNNG